MWTIHYGPKHHTFLGPRVNLYHSLGLLLQYTTFRRRAHGALVLMLFPALILELGPDPFGKLHKAPPLLRNRVDLLRQRTRGVSGVQHRMFLF